MFRIGNAVDYRLTTTFYIGQIKISNNNNMFVNGISSGQRRSNTVNKSSNVSIRCSVTQNYRYLVVLVGSQFSYQDLIIWFQVSTAQGKNRIFNCTK